jgi:hypothetical protein
VSEVINSNSESENIRNSEFDFGYLERATKIAKKIIFSSINYEIDKLEHIKNEINDAINTINEDISGMIIEDAENARSLKIMNLKSMVYSEIDGDYILPTQILMNSIDNWHL